MGLLLKDKERRKVKFLSLEELEKLNTKRLLTFYKKEREMYYRFIGGQSCDCCGERMVNLYPNDEYYKNAGKLEEEWDSYLKQIKELLNKREHVKIDKNGKVKNNRKRTY